MSFSNLPSLVIEPRWSRQRSGLLLASVIICVLVPWLIPHWSAQGSCALSVISLLMLAIGYYRAGWWGAQRMTRVTWQQSGEWHLEYAHNHQHLDHVIRADLRDDSYVGSWLMVLRWQADSRTHSLMLLRGELSNHAWRQWQARLRLEAGRAMPAVDTPR